MRNAQDVLARNVLRACLTALAALQVERPDRLQALDGRVCQTVPDLSLPGLDARTFPVSRITLPAGRQERLQVRVTSGTGQTFEDHLTLTPHPASGNANPVGPRWMTLALRLLTFLLTVTLLSLIPPVRLLAWTAAPLLLLGGEVLWTVSRSAPTDDGPATTVGLLL